ncbi:UDP-N-acetyl-D-mannosamine dehydrogenase [Verrucomicrobiales bacterium]|nr:UDP-N-acetyl-D-mannosamine dehydrogenase [Verrucomicrobiales bacterium]
MDKVVIVGLGYIGLPTAALIASQKIKVHGVDVNEETVRIINQGKAHFLEPDLDQLINTSVSKGFLTACTSAVEANVFMIVVPTPFKGDHEPDISFIEEATKSISPYLKKGDLYIIESTSPVGTTEKMRDCIFSLRPDLKNEINIAYCPERVLPGNIMFELVNNDRVIGGIDDNSTKLACEFYKRFVKGQLHETNSRTAELCKLVENASRDVQIAFANELSLICDKAKIDVLHLIELANKHPRVNILKPGCGVGGHCIAVDPYFISSRFPLESKIISTSRQINNYKSIWCFEKILDTRAEYKNHNNKDPIIALLGLSFKPDIDDLRESPACFIAEKVIKHFGEEGIIIVEPYINDHPNFRIKLLSDAIEVADIVVFLVNHSQFRRLDNELLKNKSILDFCGAISKYIN